MEGGALVCGQWKHRSLSTGTEQTTFEWYPIDTMNRHLANIGTPEAVGHIDEEVRAELKDLGVERIETCEDARDYVRIGSARAARMPELDVGRDPAWRKGLPVEEPPTVAEGQDGELVDKILNGTGFDHANVVGISSTGGGGCTGQLISSYGMLTAAHCLAWAATPAFGELVAWVRPATTGSTEQCVTHATGGACPSLGSFPANVYAQHHPSYDGTPSFDQAVVIINPGWVGVGATSARWTRFARNSFAAGRALSTGATIRQSGYGNNTTGGTGFGRGRSGTNTISSVNGANEIRLPRTGSGGLGTCTGDSGSAPHNTSSMIGFNLAMGTLVRSDDP